MNIFFNESKESFDFRQEANNIMIEFTKEEIKYKATVQTLDVYIENTMDITERKAEMLYEKAMNIYVEQTESIFTKFGKWLKNIIDAILGKAQEIKNNNLPASTPVSTDIDIAKTKKFIVTKKTALASLVGLVGLAGAGLVGSEVGKRREHNKALQSMANQKSKNDQKVDLIRKEARRHKDNYNKERETVHKIQQELNKIKAENENSVKEITALKLTNEKLIKAGDLRDLAKELKGYVKEIEEHLEELDAKKKGGNPILVPIAKEQMSIAKDALNVINKALDDVNTALSKATRKGGSDVDMAAINNAHSNAIGAHANAKGGRFETDESMKVRKRNVDRFAESSTYDIDDILYGYDEYLTEAYEEDTKIDRNIDSLIDLINML